jgi:hypothetical protein
MLQTYGRADLEAVGVGPAPVTSTPGLERKSPSEVKWSSVPFRDELPESARFFLIRRIESPDFLEVLLLLHGGGAPALAGPCAPPYGLLWEVR